MLCELGQEGMQDPLRVDGFRKALAKREEPGK